MTDDLVKRLREYGHVGTVLEAADRIEELERERDGLQELNRENMRQWAAAIDRAEAAEAEVAHLRTAAGAAAKELRAIAGMDMIGASAVAYNAAHDLERALAQGEQK